MTPALALERRLATYEQLDPAEEEAALPPQLLSFLSHLRLLVGVPFEYLVPDARLLPDESIRFFYVDRTWTDRLVDGAMAVGKIGTRDQALHHGHARSVRDELDRWEHGVRSLQRRQEGVDTLHERVQDQSSALLTGFLLRSAAVSGWPHMDVRAYRRTFPSGYRVDDPAVVAAQLLPLRIERLSPAVLLALFDGVPEMVVLEEPHHGMQFGVHRSPSGAPRVALRREDGFQELRPVPGGPGNEILVDVPVRAAHPRVVHVAELRRRLQEKALAHNPALAEEPPPTQVLRPDGPAQMAVGLLRPPWRQRFQGTTDQAGGEDAPFLVQAQSLVASLAEDGARVEALKSLLRGDR